MTILLNNINSFLQKDLLTVLLCVIWFFSWSLILSDLLNKKQGEMYLISFAISSFLLLLGGLLNNIVIFYYLGWLLIIGYFIYVICTHKLSRILKEIDIFSSVWFLIIFILLFIFYQNKGFVATDEFMHWGPMVREMFNINKFYCVPESSLIVHKDYPPFFSLIELLFCLFKGEYRECYLYVGLLSFYFSIVIAFVSNKEKIKDKIICLLVFVILGFTAQAIPGPDFESVSIFMTIYIDYFLAVFAGYIIYYEYYISINNKTDKLINTILVGALLLSKQIAIVFYILYLLVLFIKKRINISSIVIPLIPFAVWTTVVKIYQITGQFSLSNILFRENVGTIAIKYLASLFTKPIFSKPFGISFVVINIFIVGILFYLSKKSKTNHYLIYVLGLVLYTIALLVLYCFVFSIEEANSLASFERYMYTYVLFGISLILFNIFNKQNNIYLYLAITVLLIIFGDFDNSNIYKIADKKDIIVIKQWGDPISFEDSKENGYVLNFDIRDYIESDQDFGELTDEISKYHYLYVYLYDDNFYNYWVDYTGDYDLENDSVFYISHENNEISYIKDNYSKNYYAIKYYLNILEREK